MAWYPAIAQESVSRMSSCFSGLLDDVTSRKDMVRRLEMAVNRLGLAIEISDKLSVTYVSLLGQRKVIKDVWIEGKELLRTHKQLEGREEVGQQLVTSSSILGRVLTRARNNPIVSLLGSDKGYLSSSTVRKFEQFAELADNFRKDVESAFSLRNSMMSSPLLRLLFEWQTVGCSKKNGTSLSAFVIWATCLEDRGVEARLGYMYDDPKMPEKNFNLTLGLRLSESTDIIGTAIRCLQTLVPQFKDAAEFAIGKLSQLATDNSNLQELTIPRAYWPVPLMQKSANMNRILRPDPICCLSNKQGPSGDNTLSSSELYQIVPEEVCYMKYDFKILLVKDKNYRLRSASDVASVALPLNVNIMLWPHFDPAFARVVRWMGVTSFEFGSKLHGSKVHCGTISIQEVLDTVGSTAKQSYLHWPELARFAIKWFSEHGIATFMVTKPITRGSAKRKR